MQPRDPFETFSRSPAATDWDEVAAALADAPKPLRQRAEEVAARVAWVAVPQRLWAARVDAFHRTVEKLLAQYQQDLLGPVDRGWLVHELHLKYFEAVRHYIDEGERDFIAMLRAGPTPDHLALARHLGVLPAGSRHHSTRWERTAALDETQRLIAASSDPEQRPTEAELARLDALVGRFAHHGEFSRALLLALGPAGLNALTGRLALLPAGPHGVDERLVELAGSIQAGLGVVLATATTRRGSEPAHPPRPHQPELTEQWVTDLLRAGRQQRRYLMPAGEHGYRSAEFYGHQLLAVLLQSPDARFDTAFLRWVGTDFYHFEQATGRPEPGPLPLNWINGGAGNDGYDPMIGLLEALHRNPEAAREFFAGTAGGESLPWVGYLLAEREWPPDHHYRGRHDPAALGYQTLGKALETAVATDPANVQSIQIVEQTVATLGENLPGSDLIPPTMREAVANLLCPYIADLNERYRADAPDLGGLGAWAGGGDAAARALRGLDRLLMDLGKHEQAAATVSATQLHFSAIELERYLAAASMSVQQRVEAVKNVMGAHAEVIAHLDRGASQDADEAAAERLERRSRGEQRMVEAIIGQPLPASPIPRRSPTASSQLLHLMAYVLVPPDDPLHDALLPGLPAPLRAAKAAGREWTDEDRARWARYVSEHPGWPDG